ncbi:MAG: FHA domain-containing protein [Anaerolineae bacterium]|nr:FHA domain-containing protein [Anaerolineae bacterium]
MLSTPFTRDLIVGRVDAQEQTQPDIDLTSVKAEESGVSRFHARFTYKEGTLYIEDMGSTNGTRINGFELVTGKTYRLTPGDEIEFGSLRLTAQVITNDKRRRQ